MIWRRSENPSMLKATPSMFLVEWWSRLTRNALSPTQGSYSLHRLIGNTGWLFADRVFAMGLNILIGIWLARYLGPDQYGLYSYALAFVALFSTLAALGLDGVIVRDIVNAPASSGETLGTIFGMKLVVSLAALGVVIGGIFWARPTEPLAHWLVAITALTLIFKPFDVIDIWFQSQIQARAAVLARNLVLAMSTAVKVGLILTAAPLLAFAWVGTAEVALIAVGLALSYIVQRQTFAAWRFSRARALNLLRECWPLIIAGLSVTIYMRIDQVMLGQMLGDKAVGIYSVATRISEMGYFIPMAVMSSLAPALIEIRKADRARYDVQIQRVFNLMVLLALAITIPGSLLATPVVSMLFGVRYVEAGAILAVHIWATLFVFLGVAQSTWDINEGLTRYGLLRTVIGAGINVLMNIVLIPIMGGLGAALSTLISQAFSACLLNMVSPLTRKIFWRQMRALLLIDVMLRVIRYKVT